MKMKKMMAMVLAAIMLLCAAGCGSKPAATQSEPAETEKEQTEAPAAETPAAETPAEATETEKPEGNPVLEYAGVYTKEDDGLFSMLFEPADEVDGVIIQAGDSRDEKTYVFWQMVGKIQGTTITYENGSKYVQDRETGEIALKYEDGSGTIEILADRKVTWKDDKEDAGKDIVLTWDEDFNQQLGYIMEGDYQNPIMNWAGPYADKNDKNKSMVIQSGSEDGSDCTITVTESINPEKSNVWTISGTFNEDTVSITYSGAVKRELTLDADANPIDEVTLYEDGTGSFVINTDDQTITWTDEKEDAGKGSLFVFRYEYGEIGAEEGATDEIAQEAP